MENSFSNESTPVSEIVSEMKSILKKEGDLNQEKEHLSRLLEQADFLLHKHDEDYNQFIELFVAMGQFDFSSKLQYLNNGDNFQNFIVTGLNMVNEELKHTIIHPCVINTLLRILKVPNAVIVITDDEGKIKFLNNYIPHLSEAISRSYIGKHISELLANYNNLKESFDKGALVRNHESFIDHKGKHYFVTVDMETAINGQKVEGFVYVINFVH
ncbi:hypothetical protein RCC89_13025 [Cytophagaceae bacterium ABcell3]|nr:hypothetical protein RCC89_13025 [Cytophagaceae bacterium ABcell3]